MVFSSFSFIKVGATDVSEFLRLDMPCWMAWCWEIVRFVGALWLELMFVSALWLELVLSELLKKMLVSMVSILKK